VGGVCGTHGRGEKFTRFLAGKPEGKRPLGKPSRKWEDRIRMDLGATELVSEQTCTFEMLRTFRSHPAVNIIKPTVGGGGLHSIVFQNCMSRHGHSTSPPLIFISLTTSTTQFIFKLYQNPYGSAIRNP
jgi:hypothetical protein